MTPDRQRIVLVDGREQERGNPDFPAFQKRLKPGDTPKAEIEKIATLGLVVRNAH